MTGRDDLPATQRCRRACLRPPRRLSGRPDKPTTFRSSDRPGDLQRPGPAGRACRRAPRRAPRGRSPAGWRPPAPAGRSPPAGPPGLPGAGWRRPAGPGRRSDGPGGPRPLTRFPQQAVLQWGLGVEAGYDGGVRSKVIAVSCSDTSHGVAIVSRLRVWASIGRRTADPSSPSAGCRGRRSRRSGRWPLAAGAGPLGRGHRPPSRAPLGARADMSGEASEACAWPCPAR
jgi:hypothetical protein